MKALAKRIARLEAKIYPSAYCLGWQDFMEDIVCHDECLAYIAVRNGKDVGYVMAYVEDGNVYVSDIAILPKHRSSTVTVELLRELRTFADTRICTAECREESYLLVSRRCDVLSLQVVEDYWGTGETAYCVSFKIK